MTADFQRNDSCDIEFLDPVKDLFLSDLSKFPAIWEVDPKKQQVDLDIYYEASNNIPVKLNDKTNELFAPLGCKVEVLNSNIITTTSSTLQSWSGNVATFYPGLPKGSGGNEIDYTEMSFKFIREDGSYTIAEAGLQDLDGGSTGFKTEFVFREDVGEVISSADATKEIWRRILNNLPYIMKTKGTTRSIKALLSCYGIPSTILDIREYGGPTPPDGTPTYYTRDKLMYGLRLEGSQYVTSSWNNDSVSTRKPDSLEIRFKTKPT